jgi:photosystem II PsbU protein
MQGLIRRMMTFVLVSLLALIAFLQPIIPMNQAVMAAAKPAACTLEGQKIDLNNANLIAFQDCPGFYPGLAKAILANGPYGQVQDVLKIADLTSEQKQLLKANLDNFAVSEPRMSVEQRMPPRPSMGGAHFR